MFILENGSTAEVGLVEKSFCDPVLFGLEIIPYDNIVQGKGEIYRTPPHPDRWNFLSYELNFIILCHFSAKVL